MSSEKTAEILNNKCQYKNDIFRTKWTEKCVEDNRDYCHNSYKSFTLCENCSNTMKIFNRAKYVEENDLETIIKNLTERINFLEKINFSIL